MDEWMGSMVIFKVVSDRLTQKEHCMYIQFLLSLILTT
jgi:hypothetical protein